MFNDLINWLKEKYLFDLVWLITKFQLIYLAIIVVADVCDEVFSGAGIVFKIAAIGWCGFSIWKYFNNETDLMESHSVPRRMLFTMTLVVWCVEALIWGSIITKLATIDWWIVPQNGLSVQNTHNGGEYMIMASALIYVSILGGLILKSLQRFWWPFKEGRDEEVSVFLTKLGEMFVKPVDINLGKTVCIIIIVILGLFAIYPFIDLFVMSSDNVVNSKKDIVKYLEKDYKIKKLEVEKVYKDKKDHKYYQYVSTKGDKHYVTVEQKYVVPKVFEKGTPRWEINIVVDGKTVKVE